MIKRRNRARDLRYDLHVPGFFVFFIFSNHLSLRSFLLTMQETFCWTRSISLIIAEICETYCCTVGRSLFPSSILCLKESRTNSVVITTRSQLFKLLFSVLFTLTFLLFIVFTVTLVILRYMFVFAAGIFITLIFCKETTMGFFDLPGRAFLLADYDCRITILAILVLPCCSRWINSTSSLIPQ